jgi:putative thioredoxin
MNVRDATESTFDADVVERSRAHPVVVDFWAAWCGPCRALGPVLEKEVEGTAGGVELVKIDIDANPALASRYNVRGIPAVKAFRDGHVVDEFVGALPPERVRAFVEALNAPTAAEQLIAGGDADPTLAAALAAGDCEGALELLLGRIEGADADERERIRETMVALFADLGAEHPTTVSYRRRLATALY